MREHAVEIPDDHGWTLDDIESITFTFRKPVEERFRLTSPDLFTSTSK